MRMKYLWTLCQLTFQGNCSELFACTGRILNEFICFSPTPDVSFIKVGGGGPSDRKEAEHTE